MIFCSILKKSVYLQLFWFLLCTVNGTHNLIICKILFDKSVFWSPTCFFFHFFLPHLWSFFLNKWKPACLRIFFLLRMKNIQSWFLIYITEYLKHWTPHLYHANDSLLCIIEMHTIQDLAVSSDPIIFLSFLFIIFIIFCILTHLWKTCHTLDTRRINELLKIIIDWFSITFASLICGRLQLQNVSNLVNSCNTLD